VLCARALCARRARACVASCACMCAHIDKCTNKKHTTHARTDKCTNKKHTHFVLYPYMEKHTNTTQKHLVLENMIQARGVMVRNQKKKVVFFGAHVHGRSIEKERASEREEAIEGGGKGVGCRV
jgi:hypothetical protein